MKYSQEFSAPLIHKELDPSTSTSSSPYQDQNSEVDQVALTVPITDDPTLPAVTFRTWCLGILACIVLAYINMFFGYRIEPMSIRSVSAQIAVVPLGHLMARTVTKRVFFQGSDWEFTLNPGPFNVKEHVLITIFASSGAGSVYAIHVVTSIRVFYKKEMTFLAALAVVLTTQVLGFGWAGMFRRFLVDPAAMWWPQNLVQVSLFRALHEKETKPKGGLTRNQFFLIAFTCSFAYYVFPGYLFPMLSSFSWLCWLYPGSIFAQQLGSGLHGLGIGAIGLDWSSMSSYLGSPLASPWFVTVNIAVGYILIMYVITPVTYWFNIYKAKSFPIFSDGLFTSGGEHYNISAIIDSDFHTDFDAYDREGPLYLSVFFAMVYALRFACLTATFVHVFIFHGKSIARSSVYKDHIYPAYVYTVAPLQFFLKQGYRGLLQQSNSGFQERKIDVHTKLMRKYKQVPEWWFTCILVVNIIVAIFTCEYYKSQLQLPWWGVVLACGLAFFFTLPIGVITAITNKTPDLNVITEYIMGYIYPGYPVANMCFKVYGSISMKQGIFFLQDFKLGHYMKIPPRTMFTAQVVGTITSALVHLTTAWWLMGTIPNICDRTLLPSGSPWTCPSDHVFYNSSVIWGIIGPRRIFGDLGYYSAINWFFLAGAIAPLLVWFMHKSFPNQHWIRLITVPVILGASVKMPPATSVNYTSWIFVGFVSGFVIYRYYRNWWSRNNYVLAGALDAGLAFMGVLLYLCLGVKHIDWWGSEPDGCPLASCPTQEGISVKGCPSFLGAV